MAAIRGQPAPKPSQVKSPVPNADAELAAALDAELASAPLPQASQNDPELEAALSEFDAPQEQPGMLSQGLDAAGRVLDYAGGLTRTGLAGVANAASVAGQVIGGTDLADAESVVGLDDVKSALKGKAPGSAEYLRRLGVPEGGSVDLGGTKFTTRGAAGFAADIATDPLTALTKLAKNVPYIKKLMNAEGLTNKATEALGEAVYKSAFPKGAEEAAETMLKHGGAPMGSATKLAQKVDDLSNVMAKTRQGMYDRATELGVAIDPAVKGITKNADAVIEAMKKDRGLAPAAAELEELLTRYKTGGPVSVDIISEWKTNLYDSLPNSAFSGPKIKGTAKRFKAALAADFRNAIVNAGNMAEKGLGDSINALNEKWGTLLGATRPLEKATQAAGGKLGLMIDGAVAATGGPQAYAAKKAFDMATGTTARTVVGKALMEAGRKDLSSRLMRQSVANITRPEVPEE